MFEIDPVVLNILARREMAIATIIFAGDVGKHPHLFGRQQAIRHRHPQHVRMTLQIEPVLQTQRTEFVFGQFVRDSAFYLTAKLGNPFLDDLMIILVVAIHGGPCLFFIC